MIFNRQTFAETRCSTLALSVPSPRDRAGDDSDVDILVRFNGRATSKRYFGTKVLYRRPAQPLRRSGDRQRLATAAASLLERDAIHV